MKNLAINSLIFIVLFLTACENTTKKENAISEEKVIEIATKAYVFGYPMILMDYTKKVSINVEQITAVFAPINQLGHFRKFPDDEFTAVVKPNVDTYYSNAWFDLKDEPIVFTVPATDRFYLLPFYDAYSNVFSVLGTRTTGNEAHTFLLTAPKWREKVPEGMTEIKSPTNSVWLIGRTQVNSAEDGATVVVPFQNGMKIDVLSKYNTVYEPEKGVVLEDVKKIVPVENTRALSIEDYFTKLTQLMVGNPPAEADAPLIAEMKSIGIIAGQKFSTEGMSDELIAKLKDIPEKQHQIWIAKITGKMDAGTPIVNNWMVVVKGMGSYGTDYDFRASIAFTGLGALLAVDAVYPMTTKDKDGNQIMGEYKYVLHFDKNQIPPVNAFWSLTAYNSKDFLIENSINRFALGDRDDLKYNEDGSLDIYIQNTDPGGDKTSNWLPSTQEGLTNLTLRLYWPKESVLDGTWIVPSVRKVK